MSIVNSNGLKVSDTTITGDAGTMLNENIKRIEGFLNNKNYLINPNFDFAQRQTPSTLTSYSDDTYGPDRWYILTQTAAIQYARLDDGSHSNLGSKHAGQFKQNQASAQRFGAAQIVESNESRSFASKSARFQIQVTCSASTDINLAILEWTGSSDSVTSDVVNSWASASLTAGGFFNSTTLTVAGTSTTSVTAATVKTISVEAAISSSVKNIIVMVWTSSTQAQNVTLDVNQAILTKVSTTGTAGNLPWVPPNYADDLLRCQRYCQKNCAIDTAPADGVVLLESYCGAATATTIVRADVKFVVVMRTTPTITLYRSSNGSSAGQFAWFTGSGYTDASSTSSSSSSEYGFRAELTTTGLTAHQARIVKGIFLAESEL